MFMCVCVFICFVLCMRARAVYRYMYLHT